MKETNQQINTFLSCLNNVLLCIFISQTLGQGLKMFKILTRDTLTSGQLNRPNLIAIFGMKFELISRVSLKFISYFLLLASGGERHDAKRRVDQH